MSFGESLVTIRKAKGISRKDFAEQLQIPYTTLRNYETDQREPGHKLLIRMATLLGTSVDELIGHQMQTKQPAPEGELSDMAIQMIETFRKIPIKDQDFAADLVESVLLCVLRHTPVPAEAPASVPVGSDR